MLLFLILNKYWFTFREQMWTSCAPKEKTTKPKEKTPNAELLDSWLTHFHSRLQHCSVHMWRTLWPLFEKLCDLGLWKSHQIKPWLLSGLWGWRVEESLELRRLASAEEVVARSLCLCNNSVALLAAFDKNSSVLVVLTRIRVHLIKKKKRKL